MGGGGGGWREVGAQKRTRTNNSGGEGSKLRNLERMYFLNVVLRLSRSSLLVQTKKMVSMVST